MLLSDVPHMGNLAHVPLKIDLHEIGLSELLSQDLIIYKMLNYINL